MTATAHATIDATAASSGRLSSVASGVLEFVWPMYLTLVFTLGAWVLVPTVVLGWQPMTIISGSMSPTIQPGHVVVVEPFHNQEVGPGTVVTFRDAHQDRLVTHRVKAVAEDGTITTKGDANRVDDPDPLTADRIVGVGRLVVPAAGLPALWLYQGRTDMLAITTVLTVLATASAASAASIGVRAVQQRVSRRREARGRPGRRRVALGTAALVIVTALGATAVSHSAFAEERDNGANSFGASTLSSPTGLTATGTCAVLDLQLNILKPAMLVTWSAASGATAYDLERGISATGPFTQVTVPLGATTVTDGPLSASTTYYYRVRSRHGTWTSPWSAPASARTPSSLCLP